MADISQILLPNGNSYNIKDKNVSKLLTANIDERIELISQDETYYLPNDKLNLVQDRYPLWLYCDNGDIDEKFYYASNYQSEGVIYRSIGTQPKIISIDTSTREVKIDDEGYKQFNIPALSDYQGVKAVYGSAKFLYGVNNSVLQVSIHGNFFAGTIPTDTYIVSFETQGVLPDIPRRTDHLSYLYDLLTPKAIPVELRTFGKQLEYIHIRTLEEIVIPSDTYNSFQLDYEGFYADIKRPLFE